MLRQRKVSKILPISLQLDADSANLLQIHVRRSASYQIFRQSLCNSILYQLKKGKISTWDSVDESLRSELEFCFNQQIAWASHLWLQVDMTLQVSTLESSDDGRWAALRRVHNYFHLLN
ncbi:unnamed protein product [Cuscuta campestris]|uniref:Uncharacterized protein n=1 Tax=Cuscuta campestris TaxID=132261 RepID=A0A484MST7_9ASTE|nr:unnamed protein product [Cuscuta campestris]